MASASMQAIIDNLRYMTSAARDDRFDGITYWSDDQLQGVLEEFRVGRPVRVPLTSSEYKVSGATQWWVQSTSLPRHYAVEDNVTVYDSSGNAVAAEDVEITRYGSDLVFTFDQNNVAQNSYEAELTLYDTYAAAAEVWGRKAAQRKSLVEIRSGVHQIKAQQEYEHCERREKFFRSRVAKVFDLPNTKRYVPASSRYTRRSH